MFSDFYNQDIVVFHKDSLSIMLDLYLNISSGAIENGIDLYKFQLFTDSI